MTSLLEMTLLEVTLRASVPAAVALLLHALLQRRSAALRHGILAAGMLAAIAVAPLSALLPAWAVALPMAPTAASGTGAPAGRPVSSDPVSSDPAAGGAVTGYAASSNVGSDDRVSFPEVVRAALVGVRPIALTLWLAGLAIALLPLLVGLVRLSRLARTADVTTDGEWHQLLHRLAARHGMRRRIVLLTTRATNVLGTWGTFRPRVLLPAQAHTWNSEQAHVALSHELAHIRRGDWPLQIAADVLRAVFWFNPVFWLLAARLRRDAEFACDDAVLESGVTATTYAAHLLDIARSCCAPVTAHVPAIPIARPSTLEGRITAMLDTHRNRQTLTRSASLLVVVALAGIALPSASFTLLAQTPGPGGLTGYVYDNTGAILPGVEIALTGGQDVRRSAVTDGTGRFSFAGVSAGSYVFEAQLPGFRTLRNEFSLAAPRDWARNITMQVGELQETIQVTAKRPVQTVPLVQTAGPQRPVRVGGVIKVPTKVKDARPVYPAELQGANLEGIVPIDALIGRDGTVTSVRVLTAEIHPAFARAAEDAVRQWVFTPTLLNGAPVEVQMGVTIRFSLED